MNRLTHVDGDDWQGLYLNGELVHQGHSVPLWVIGEEINSASQGIQEFITIVVDYDWMSLAGMLPVKLEDIPEEVIL